MKRVLLIMILLTFFSSEAQAVSLGVLMKIAREQQEMERILKEETDIYNCVKDAVKKKKIAVGESQATIIKKYGKPVVAISKEGSLERWVYKPSYASYFDRTKIYLFFDGKILKEIRDMEK
ncbi:MAG: hypothetical protein ISS34_01860 [Candidatus Omnitrophica bacterium]|nr:hypothetical protein [Candidatus Omnitrophota bacterium]